MDITKIGTYLFTLGISPFWIYLGAFTVIMLSGLGLPLPEDIPLLLGGYLAYLKIINVHLFFLYAFISVILSDSIIFVLGYKFGPKLMKKRFFSRFITRRSIALTRLYFYKYGNKIFFIARFMPGLRAPIYFSGGAFKSKFYIFFIFDFLAALISVPLWIYTAYYFGEIIETAIAYAQKIQGGIVGVIVLYLLFLLYKFYRKKKRVIPVEN